MIAVITGPYCAGAATPTGAGGRVTCPHGHRLATRRCSTTRIVTGGRSKTCRRIVAASAAPPSPDPQPAQVAGSWRTTSSGSGTWHNVRPRWPSCPPGFRPDLPRNDFGDGLPSPSDDGGFDEDRKSTRLNSSHSQISYAVFCL